MLVIAISYLALVVGQVVSQAPPFTMNDEDGEVQIEQLPFEMTNPSRVAGGELYQSDMLLTDEQWAALRERKAISSTSARWTEVGGVPFVPYVFQDSVDQTSVTDALDHWETHTCITFGETTNTDQPHLQFHIGSGCWSYIGMVAQWNGQEVSIGTGCNGLGTVVHEVGHAMGFYHEQSRSDRDDHVVILTENIESGKEGNFDKAADDNFGVPYDYSSNMHYGTTYFTVNGNPTIVTINPMAQELIGSRNGLTHRDKLLANRMYGCIDKWLAGCPGLTSDPCLNDGYTQADCTCACPPGTSGSTCETITGDYYDALQKRSEKITTETTITVKTPMDACITFSYWIDPPTCKSAKVEFTFGNMYADCNYQYVTVRTEPTDYTGEKLCAADVSGGRTFTSETAIIILMSNRVTYSFERTLWTADVTFEDIVGCAVTTTIAPTTTPVPPTTTLAPTDAPTTIAPTTTPVPPTTTLAPTVAPTTIAPTTTPVPPPTTTTAPTNPPTTSNPLNTTTMAPPMRLSCSRRPRKTYLRLGSARTLTSPGFPNTYPKNKIRCGWKLKAKYPAKKIEITCDTFELNGRDVLRINRDTFNRDNAPTTAPAKWLGIHFISKKRSYGPGFTCVVRGV